MASCVTNIHTKNYYNLVTGFQVTVKNVGDVFLGHRVYWLSVHNLLTFLINNLRAKHVCLSLWNKLRLISK